MNQPYARVNQPLRDGYAQVSIARDVRSAIVQK